MADTSSTRSAVRVPRGKMKRTTSAAAAKPNAKATKPGKKSGQPKVSRPAKRPSAKKAPARKPTKARRASVSAGKGGPGLPGAPKARPIFKPPKPKKDFMPVAEVYVKNPNDKNNWIDTLKLIGHGKNPGNTYVARELKSDGNGPLAGKHNNRGCAHGWLGQVNEARAAFYVAVIEAEKTIGGAKIKKIAEFNLGLLP